MKLGQFATAVGAPAKWVQNARAVLGEAGPYTVERARVLALTRILERSFDLSLRRAHELAVRTLENLAGELSWRHESADGCVIVEIVRGRFLAEFAVNLSRANVQVERRRGRKPRKRRRGLAAARARGVDISMLRESLRRTPAERLRRLAEDAEFVKSLRVVQR
jgi:hypothetical protein